MNHDQVREILGPYLEGELASAQQLVVERHLTSCPACTTEYRELRATVALLRSLPEPEVPAGFSERVLDRAREQAAGAGLSSWLRSLWEGPWVAALAAGTAGLLVWAVVGPRGALPLLPERERVTVDESLAFSRAAPDPGATAADETLGSILSASEPEPESRALASNPQRTTPAISPPASGTPGSHMAKRIPVLPPGGLRHVVVGGSAARSDRARRSAPRLAPHSGALPPRPGLAVCRGIDSMTAEPAGTDLIACRPWLAGMTTLATYDARAFMSQLDATPAPEREPWADLIVRYALETGRAGLVGQELASSRDIRIRALGSRFLTGTTHGAAGAAIE
jgi:hypothetical protein